MSLISTKDAEAVASTEIFSPAISTIFETSGRFAQTTTSGGTSTFGTQGVTIATSATISSAEKIRGLATLNLALDHVSRWFCSMTSVTQGTDFEEWCGCGEPTVNATEIEFTDNQFGIKSERASSGTVTVDATNGNGTTEEKTDLGKTTITGNWCIVRASSTSLKFYFSSSTDSTFALVATHTENISTASANPVISAGITNMDTATDSKMRLENVAFQVQVTT